MKTTLLLIFMSACVCHAEPQKLFNGKDLTGWMVIPFTEGGKVQTIEKGVIECEMGNPLNGIVYTNATPPVMNYELSLEAKRVEGSDFFIALTIPVEDRHCTVIIGGWGGGVCGVSSIDNLDAGLNQWSKGVKLKNNIWYRLRARVTPGVLQVFLNDNLYSARIEYINSERITLRPGSEIPLTKPLGLATYHTRAHWRNFTLERVTAARPGDKPRL